MTDAGKLSRERIEELIHFAKIVMETGGSDRGRDTLFALRELLALRDERVKLRETVEFLEGFDETMSGKERDEWERAYSDLRAAIGRRSDGTWEG